MGTTAKNLTAMTAVVADYRARAGDAHPDPGRLLAAGCVMVDWALPAPIVGRDAIVEEAIRPYRAAFPGGAHEVHDVVCDGSRLVLLATFTGRFEHAYGDLAPSGALLSWAVRDVWTFEDGLARRIDVGGDTLAAATQLSGHEDPESEAPA